MAWCRVLWRVFWCWLLTHQFTPPPALAEVKKAVTRLEDRETASMAVARLEDRETSSICNISGELMKPGSQVMTCGLHAVLNNVLQCSTVHPDYNRDFVIPVW